MTSSAEHSRVEQRLALRRELAAQRQLIAYQLGPSSGITGSFPRSMTMRLVTRQPALAAKLLVGIATFLVGVRIFGSITTALTVARIVRSTYIARSRRLPAVQTSNSPPLIKTMLDESKPGSLQNSAGSII